MKSFQSKHVLLSDNESLGGQYVKTHSFVKWHKTISAEIDRSGNDLVPFAGQSIIIRRNR